MPEITSVENIRSKLREFDERMSGAISAADALNRIRHEAAELFSNLEQQSVHCETHARDLAASGERLKSVETEWHERNRAVEVLQIHAQEVCEAVTRRVNTAIEELVNKSLETEVRLTEFNRISLEQQCHELRQLDASTRASAEVAEHARSAASQHAECLDLLLRSLRQDLTGQIDARLNDFETSQVASFAELSRRLEDVTAAQRRDLWNLMSDFKSEMKRQQAMTEQSLDRQITEFLSKQNVLVQNLTQQIDSYYGVSQALSSGLGATTKKLDEFIHQVSAFRIESGQEMSAVTENVQEVKSTVRDAQAQAALQVETISTLRDTVRAVEKRLEETVQKLSQRSWFTGIK